jgi:hypothetical protein
MANRVTVIGSTYGLPPGLRTPAASPKAGARAYSAQVAPGWVVLQPEGKPELTVLCELTNAPDADAESGWVEVQRQRSKALSRWEGFDGMEAPLDLYIDGMETGRPIDDIYDNLEALRGRGRRAGQTTALALEPPKVIVDTAGVFRHDTSVFPDTRWVIASLEWDPEETITDEAGRRMRAVATVVIREYVASVRLQNAALRAARRDQAKAKKSKSYTVKDGDTLVKIARIELHDASRGQEIADLNDIRDPAAVKPGARIRLP